MANFSYLINQISIEGHSPHASPNGQGKSPKKPSHSRSYSRVPPPTESRRLISVKSEGSTTVRKNVNVGEIASESLIAPRENPDPNDTREMDYSSDESGGEDEHIVRIDSPSTLSFPRVP